MKNAGILFIPAKLSIDAVSAKMRMLLPVPLKGGVWGAEAKLAPKSKRVLVADMVRGECEGREGEKRSQ